ncbi:MAG: HAMP domain-containing histidine kinase, partial [Gemmatimonadetes bacterium]|nr:HAMP domain-containing histidine kinase [Gemmatimonadota bacterium]
AMESSKYPEAAFLAAMTASATHEVRNVLAIIKESAGLVDDLVEVQGAAGRLDPEKVRKALERIGLQVRRGADLLTHLNRLAHTLDQDLSTVELNQEVQQLVFLNQRFARQKGQQVLFEGSQDEQQLQVNALHLHMLLSAATRCCLDELPEGCKVSVGVLEEGGSAVVEFGSVDGDDLPEASTDCAGWSELEALSDSLGAKLERSPGAYGVRILFSKEPRG